MKTNPYDRLSRRERQIMDILMEMKEATAEQVRVRLPDPPGYSAARAMLSKLEAKGFVRHAERDLRYVYAPKISHSAARTSAISRLIDVFFGGSVPQAVTGMVDMSADRLSDDDLERIAEKIDEARKTRGKKRKRR